MERKFGRTVGKMIFKLSVITSLGRPAGLRQILLRNLVKVIEMSWAPLLLFPLLNRNRLRLGDLVARTAVIDARIQPPPQETDQSDDGEAGPDKDD